LALELIRMPSEHPGVVLDALRALGPRPALHELEMVAAGLRRSTDPDVRALFYGLGAPISEREAWERLKALVLDAESALRFTAMDLFTEVGNPGAYARVLARGCPDPENPSADERARAGG
jgi:hypothetical protein